MASENAAEFTKGRGAEELYRIESRFENEPGKKLEAIHTALRISPGSYLARFQRAHLYDQLGRREEALADHTEALRLDPRMVKAQLGRADTYLKEGRRAEALADFTRASELSPGREDLR